MQIGTAEYSLVLTRTVAGGDEEGGFMACNYCRAGVTVDKDYMLLSPAIHLKTSYLAVVNCVQVLGMHVTRCSISRGLDNVEPATTAQDEEKTYLYSPKLFCLHAHACAPFFRSSSRVYVM